MKTSIFFLFTVLILATACGKKEKEAAAAAEDRRKFVADSTAQAKADSLTLVEAEKEEVRRLDLEAGQSSVLAGLISQLQLSWVGIHNPRIPDNMGENRLEQLSRKQWLATTMAGEILQSVRLLFGSEIEHVLDTCASNPELLLSLYNENRGLIAPIFKEAPIFRDFYRESKVTILYLEGRGNPEVIQNFRQYQKWVDDRDNYTGDEYDQVRYRMYFVSDDDADLHYEQWALVERWKARSQNPARLCEVSAYILRDLDKVGIWDIFFPRREGETPVVTPDVSDEGEKPKKGGMIDFSK